MRKTGSLQEKIDKFPGGKEQIYQKKNSSFKKTSGTIIIIFLIKSSNIKFLILSRIEIHKTLIFSDYWLIRNIRNNVIKPTNAFYRCDRTK